MLPGLVWTPCSGPLLASAMKMVTAEGGAWSGAVLLGRAAGLFGVGAATPLVAAAYASRHGFAAARAWVPEHVARPKAAFGLLVGTVGVAILTGADRWFEVMVVQVLPDARVAIAIRF